MPATKKQITDTVTQAVKGGALGLKRMLVTITCVLAITFIDYIHVALEKDISTNSITAMCLIAALGGVDVWKHNFFKKGKGD